MTESAPNEFWQASAYNRPRAWILATSLAAHCAGILLLYAVRPSPPLHVQPRYVTLVAPSVHERITPADPRPIHRMSARPPVPLNRPALFAPELRTPRVSPAVVDSPPSIAISVPPTTLPIGAGAPQLPPSPLAPPLEGFDTSAAPKAVRSAALVSGTFGDASVVAAPKHARPEIVAPPVSSTFTAAEILFKPEPAYTDRARQLHVKGEVLVEVVFAGSGEIRVIRVIEGLGYGLDENAISAARAIRFRPALRDGQPVDSLAVVHISFQIAD